MKREPEPRSVYEDRGVMTTADGWRLPWRKEFGTEEEPLRLAGTRRPDTPEAASARAQLNLLRKQREKLDRQIARLERELEEA